MKDVQTLPPYLPKQRGAALIMGLLVLMVMILLVITATNSTLMQNRMAGNFRDVSLGFQASEAASRWSMSWLLSLDELARPFPCASACNSTSRVWHAGQYPGEPSHKDSFWATARSYGIDPSDDSAVSPAQSIPLVIAQPRFIMEQVYFARDDLAGPPQVGVAYYRVSSLGYAATSTSHAVLAAVMGKRYQ